MIVLPILGILMQQARDRTVALLGIPLPVFTGVDKEFSKGLREVHGTIGNVVIGLIAVHAAAAVRHHFKQHDNTHATHAGAARLICSFPPVPDCSASAA